MKTLTFIAKDGESNYYTEAPGGAGSAFTPPGHATQKFSIIEKRGGHETGIISIEYAATCEYVPASVRLTAKNLLRKYPGDVKSEEWIKSVYTHMRHCYETPSGENLAFGKSWGNADQESNMNPEYHKAVIYIRQYDPAHQPRTDLF